MLSIVLTCLIDLPCSATLLWLAQGAEASSSLDTTTRRDKLARLRRAVSALQADAYAGRLGAGCVASVCCPLLAFHSMHCCSALWLFCSLLLCCQLI